MSITLTDQDKLTLRTAAYGAVSLLAAADATGNPHKIATEGSTLADMIRKITAALDAA
ncbi:hypothetical protein [Nonomuraea sp. NPDC003201]